MSAKVSLIDPVTNFVDCASSTNFANQTIHCHMSSLSSLISFDDTTKAFAYKSDAELKKAHFLFKFMGFKTLVDMGVRVTPWAIKVGLPINGIIRNTLFSQFVGGETLEQTARVASKLGNYHVQVILDYGVEGKEGEHNFDHARDEFIRVIQYAATQKNIPYMSVKVTGFARFGLLEKLDHSSEANAGTLMKRFTKAVEDLDAQERAEWERVVQRMTQVCVEAEKVGIGVLIDAEETWIQDPVDALVMLMMDRFNKGKIVIYNTLQHYRHDRIEFLRDSIEAARQRNFILAVKLVRGAYMEKERDRASEKGYPSPIQPDKDSTDRDYDLAVKMCIDNIDFVAVMIASHNDQSNLLGVKLLEEKGLPLDHKHVHFSQLFGMSDNITFNLASAGCSVSKYLPFGPIKDVVPYLMRRAQENSSIGGQTGRELNLIEKEMKRRGLT
jgi:proline dehydrogenase